MEVVQWKSAKYAVKWCREITMKKKKNLYASSSIMSNFTTQYLISRITDTLMIKTI